MERSEGHISFELLGEKFTVKSDVPRDYFLRLVSYLEDKFHEVQEKLPNLSNIKVIIFAALDIADELFKQKESMGTLDKDALKLITDLSESLASAMDEEE